MATLVQHAGRLPGRRAIGGRRVSAGKKIDRALASAAARLDADETTGEIANTLRGLRRDMEAIPAPIRAMEYLSADAEYLVAALTGGGVRFASRKNAPSQIAGSAYAAWMLAYRSGGGESVDWTLVASMFVEGVVHAMRKKNGVPKNARRMLEDAAALADTKPRHRRRGR